MKAFSDEKDALVKDEDVVAGIDGAANANPAPTAGSPLDTVKTKLEASYGTGTKAVPAAPSRRASQASRLDASGRGEKKSAYRAERLTSGAQA